MVENGQKWSKMARNGQNDLNWRQKIKKRQKNKQPNWKSAKKRFAPKKPSGGGKPLFCTFSIWLFVFLMFFNLVRMRPNERADARKPDRASEWASANERAREFVSRPSERASVSERASEGVRRPSERVSLSERASEGIRRTDRASQGVRHVWSPPFRCWRSL